MKMIKRIPLPIAGLTLGIATMGNMFAYIGNNVRYPLGIIAGILFSLLLIRIFTNIRSVKEDLKNPVLVTVMGTFNMALMVLATYIALISMPLAKAIWITGVAMHVLLIVYTTIRYIFSFDIEKVFATYFVAYVGIVAASTTAPAFQYQYAGQICFYFGFVSYIILLPVIFYRVFKIKNIPQAVLPTCIIIAAPASLCLAGYINSFGVNANTYFICGLGIAAIIMTLIGLRFVPKVLKGDFYPSFASLTFPFVISAFAMKLSSAFLLHDESFKVMGSLFKFTYAVEAVFAVVMVLFVFMKYMIFIVKGNDVKKTISIVQEVPVEVV